MLAKIPNQIVPEMIEIFNNLVATIDNVNKQFCVLNIKITFMFKCTVKEKFHSFRRKFNFLGKFVVMKGARIL